MQLSLKTVRGLKHTNKTKGFSWLTFQQAITMTLNCFCIRATLPCIRSRILLSICWPKSEIQDHVGKRVWKKGDFEDRCHISFRDNFIIYLTDLVSLIWFWFRSFHCAIIDENYYCSWNEILSEQEVPCITHKAWNNTVLKIIHRFTFVTFNGPVFYAILNSPNSPVSDETTHSLYVKSKCTELENFKVKISKVIMQNGVVNECYRGSRYGLPKEGWIAPIWIHLALDGVPCRG